MRSLTLCLRNINSLRGEHLVDFTDPVLAGVDLFGITGPTGSGKSTLLDAITLALYGRVVRHGGSSSPEPSVSTHTADASAVYRFSVQGVVHEARWSMRRARGRLDGAFQQPVRELLRFRGDGSSESLAEGNAKVNTAVEELLGLGFEQFQRVALLPQGEFDRFLTSNETDRAGILEKLTGTGPYHVYGHRIHEKWVEAKTEVESIRNWMGGVEATLMTDEARAAAEADRDNRQREHVALSAVSKSLAERLSQANQLAKALDEQASCTQQERDLQREIARNEPETAKVRRWRALEPAYRAESLVRSAGIAAGKARRDAVDAREQAQDATGRWKLQQAQALDFGKRQMLQDLADARRVARRFGFAEPADIARAVGLAENLGRELQRVSQALVPCVAAIDARELAAEKHWRRLHKVANSPAQLSGLEAVPPHGPDRRRLFDETLGWASGRVPAVAAEAELSKKVAEVALAASAGAKTIVELKRQLAEGGQCGVCGSDIPSGRIAAIPSVEDLESAAEEAQAAWEKAVKRSESIAQWMDWVRAERLEWETATRNAELAEGRLPEVLSQTGLSAFAATPEALET
ncbi:MAG: AAA family ATPase, partial [Armatimonadaceae bacterium]